MKLMEKDIILRLNFELMKIYFLYLYYNNMVMGKVYKYNPKKKSVKVSTFTSKKSAQVNNRQLTKKIKQVINKDKEPKWVQGQQNNFATLTANQGYGLNITANIPQGDTVSARDGDDIFLTFVKIALKFSWDVVTNAEESVNFRVLLVRTADNVASGASFTNANLPTNRQLVHSLIDNPDKDRMVLYDKIHSYKTVWQSTSTNNPSTQNAIIRFNRKLFYRMNYQEGQTYSNKPKSNLILYVMADRAIATSTAIDNDVEWLVGFKDI